MEPKNGMDYGQVALDIVEHSPSIAIRVSGANGQWETLFISKNISGYGYTREEFLSGRVTWMDLVHPDDLQPLCGELDAYEEQGVDSYTTYYRVVKKSGEAVWVSDVSTVSRDDAGNVVYSDCIISDYTSVKLSQEKIEDNLRQQSVLNDILQSLHDSDRDKAFQIILNRTGEYLDISRVIMFEDNEDHTACRAVYEWCNEGISSMMGQGDFCLNYREDIPEIEADLLAKGKRIVNYGDIPTGCTDEFDNEGVVAAAIFSVYLPGGAYGFICFDECVKERRWEDDTIHFLQNISKLVSTALTRKLDEESIRHMAYYDRLTGLTNRYQFDLYLEKAMHQARKLGKRAYVLFIDMDDFKIINDGYGHDYGDALLVEVANYFREELRDEDMLFRFGGDEFVVLIDTAHAPQMEDIVHRILKRAQRPWHVLDKRFYCTFSIGVVGFCDEESSATEVLQNADLALYQAKRQGKNNYFLYSSELDNDSIARAEMEHKMRQAIELDFDGFEVYFQPLADKDGLPYGAEALVRWHDDEGNLLSPAGFIPLAEYLGLIVPLGEFVLRTAAEECRRVNETHPNFSISVNVSVKQLQQHDFLSCTEAILRESGVDFANIVLEITEGTAMQDLQYIKHLVGELRSMGLRVAMDDFGTGYSSLNSMREIPLDMVKIDRSFIGGVTHDAYAKSFIRLITDLTHTMGRVVCVEGVETAEQWDYCVQCSADILQGFYFWRPMPIPEFRKLMEESTAAVGKTLRAPGGR